jgi:hypothetical protein
MANQTCEQCGAVFPQPTGAVEVVSTRILCPACAEARRLAKLAAKQAAAQGAAAPAAQVARQASAGNARPSAVPASPSAARPAVASSSSAGAARPTAGAARPTAGAARPTAGAARPTAVSARAAASPPKPAVPTPIAGSARSKTETNRLAGKKASAAELDEVRREARALKEKENKILMVGWVAGLVILLGAGGVYLYKRATEDSRAAALAKYEGEVQEVLAEIAKFDLKTEAGALAAKKYLEGLGARAKREELREPIATANIRVAKALDGFAKTREFIASLEKLERDVASVGSLSSDQIQDLRLNRETLDLTASTYGGDASARLAAMRNRLDEQYALRMYLELGSLPTAPPAAARTSLTRFGVVEDIVYTMWVKSRKDSNKALSEPLDNTLQKIIRDSDVVCMNAFSQEEIDKVAWTDLLQGQDKSEWVKSDAPGFSYDINARGEMRVTGPNAEAKGQGVLSIGDRDKWRDFVCEMNLEIVRGNFDMYIRAPLGSFVNTEYYPFSTEGDSSLQKGTTYALTIKVIGSTWSITSDSQDFGSTEDLPIKSFKTRAGAIAFSVPGGTELTIRKMRIKKLR